MEGKQILIGLPLIEYYHPEAICFDKVFCDTMAELNKKKTKIENEKYLRWFESVLKIILPNL